MPLTINIPDTLRRSVESASNGKNTVLYTAQGQPCFMFVLPKFDMSTIPGLGGSGTHPAFIVNGTEKNQIFLGQHLGARRNGELVSAPGLEPVFSITHDKSVTLGRANGPGWHAMTNAEWGAIQCACIRDGYIPGGNNNQGRDAETGLAGVRADGLAAGASGGARTLTGSGPASWRHDGTAFGIADLHGNQWEWAPGLRIVDYEIQVLADNNAAAADNGAMASGSQNWRAIDGSDGALIAPGSANAVKYSNSGVYAINGSDFSSITDRGTSPISAAALQRLRALGAAPIVRSANSDYLLTSNSERLPFRGGSWGNGSQAGLFALLLNYARSSSISGIGARPAFVI